AGLGFSLAPSKFRGRGRGKKPVATGPLTGAPPAARGGMRILTIASFALLAACGTDPALPGPGSDLATSAVDAASHDGAQTGPDHLVAVRDLEDHTSDLTVAPDLSMPQQGGGMCGGFIGKPCPPGQFCDIPNGCGGADESGTCVVKPMACLKNYDPVCGCD